MNTGIITLWLPADGALVNEELDLDLTTTTPEDLIIWLLATERIPPGVPPRVLACSLAPDGPQLRPCTPLAAQNVGPRSAVAVMPVYRRE